MKSIIAIGLAVLVATPAVAADPAPLAVILRGPEQAVLTHPLTDTTVEQRLELAATDVFIDSSSRIDVSARGYLGSRSGGNPVDSGLTLGNTALNSSTRRNGGGYGGSGGIGSVGGTGNMLYGIPEDPTDPGSGGGSDGGAAGNGGGVVRLQAGTLQLDGMVLANGGNEGYLGGGGTGGAIRLTAKTLSGAGAVQAGGGNGDGNYGSGGGGGRIAIHYENGAAFTFYLSR